jgi:putative endonuclease
MFYAYVLETESSPGELYRGYTADLKQRLTAHNNSRCPHTAKFRPWKLRFYAAFETIALAQQFERYFKSGSGHSFSKSPFWVVIHPSLGRRLVPDKIKGASRSQ